VEFFINHKRGLFMDIRGERWESVIELEIDFYLNFSKYKQEINESLKENELDIKYPVTRYENGEVFRSCPGTEQQALHRIERRDALNAILQRASKRISRLFNAMEQLNELEHNVLYFLYFNKTFTLHELARLLDFKNIYELQKTKKTALKTLYKMYKQEREEKGQKYNLYLIEERKKKIQIYKGLKVPG
jgi:hypothetical protein